MNQIKLKAPSGIDTTITLPSSKSICNRALIMHYLADNKGKLDNLSDCDDTAVMVRALDSMPPVIDIMAAGTAMRFLTACLSVVSGTHVITGTARMLQRPIGILVDALRSLGASVRYAGNEGFPPLEITGTALRGGHIALPGNVSSQYVSALLMIGPMLAEGLRLTLTGTVVSRPYILLTVQLMQEFGARVVWHSDHEIEVMPGGYTPVEYYRVESDWSAASYWYEMAALAPQAVVRLPYLSANSFQGDSKVAVLFEQLGVTTHYTASGVELRKSGKRVERFEYDFVEQPDLAQTFVVTCALLGIPFHFYGLQSLKIKETDRIYALKTEMRKLGYVIHDANDSELYWEGERCQTNLSQGIDTYEDHRMAMAFAPACFVLDELRINAPEVVSKSYPHFWDNLTHAGFTIIESK